MTRRGGTRNEISGGVFFSAVIQGRDITVQLPLEITPALSGLPMGTQAFTGRDTDLRVLLDILAPRPIRGDDIEIPDPDTAPAFTAVVAAVSGLAGIGKTELVIQAARAALDRGWFPGGVLFVDLFGYDPARNLEPGQALEGFLRALAIPDEHIPPHTQDRARLYTSVLAAYAREGRRILVVIDNAVTHEQARPLLPADSASTAIVTSRDTLGLLGARLLNLDTLAPEAAASMLDWVLRASRPGDTRVTDHPPDAFRVARLCGGLPLALRIIAALLSENPHRPLAEMAADLDDERTRLGELSYADTAVSAAFDLSYQRLDHDLTRLFRLLAINPGPEISTQATAVLADVAQPVARRGLEALARAHLIDHGGSYGHWRMHDLLRLYARNLLDAHADADEREEARDRLLRYYSETVRAAVAHLRALPRAPFPSNFTSRDTALAWLDGERASIVSAVAMAADAGRDEIAIRLPLDLADYLSWRRRFDDWLSTTMISRDSARRLQDRNNEAGALNNLGIALQGMRRFEEAIRAYQDAAAISRDTGDRHGEGNALNNLGVALRTTRRFEEAITALRDVVVICRETGDRHGEGGALNNLGSALIEARRFEEAITAQREAAAIFQDTGDRRGEGGALINLGLALVEVRRFEEAITAYQQGLIICREAGDRHGEGDALNNLGSALREMRRFEEAITAHQDAAAIYRETGDRHGEGTALDGLGFALAGVRRFEEAITAHQDAAAIYRDTGDRHGEGIALNNLGIALRGTRRFEEAITALGEAVAIYRDTGDRHGEGMALSNLGIAVMEVHRPEEAITALGEAVAIFRETGDVNRGGTALDVLGLVLREVRRFEEAITAHQNAAAAYRDTGDRHGEGTALNHLGLALRHVGQLEEAITAHQNAATIYRETRDRHHEGIALNNLGIALAETGRFEEAITAFQDAAAIYRETGDRHGEGAALSNLGGALRATRRFEEAITAHQDAAAIYRNTGDRHREGIALDNLELDRAAQRT